MGDFAENSPVTLPLLASSFFDTFVNFSITSFSRYLVKAGPGILYRRVLDRVVEADFNVLTSRSSLEKIYIWTVK